MRKSFRVVGYSRFVNQRTAADNVAEVLNLARTVNDEDHRHSDWESCKAHKTLVVSPVPNQPLWDFADAQNRIFQVTIAATHGLNGHAVLHIPGGVEQWPESDAKEIVGAP